ncbi:MAG TPA: hypothetical protein VFU86_19255 [Terriglobales bacterium]|nr:hypothetical protein [Terriglobales bacterium]
MRRKIEIGLVLLLLTAPAFSLQTQQNSQANKPSTPKPKTATSGKSSPEKESVHHWKTYCSEEAEYCISYPPDWDVVGDVMEGNGVVMAPPQNGKEKDLWDDVTVSVTDLPDSEGKVPPSFDDIVSVALNGLPGKNVETLQRSQLTLHDRDAELIKVRYNDKETNRAWVEEIVFIDDQLAIYSIALRATPDDVAGLEETFRRIVATWRPSEAETEPKPVKPAVPKGTETKPPGM